ncbi:MAG: hypothetical protein JW704_12375 [Anaerolineaceae bacterium]|nr:hypothetical protein [Anaerolineaceae bacterium]
MKLPSEQELRSQIHSFLRDFKELMGQGCYLVKDHLKNIQALRDLGINARLRDEMIFSIALEDYSSGPSSDEYQRGYFWIFGKYLESVEIYIKLKIITFDNGNERAVCISFHPSEHPLKYPLKRDTNSCRPKRS